MVSLSQSSCPLPFVLSRWFFSCSLKSSTRSRQIFSDIRNFPFDGGCYAHLRAHQVSSAARSLATLKIAVTRGRTAFASFQLIVVHSQTHGTTRVAPFESSLNKQAIQSFLLGLAAHPTASTAGSIRTWPWRCAATIGRASFSGLRSPEPSRRLRSGKIGPPLSGRARLTA